MRPLCLVAAGAACAIVLFASDFWKTKDSSQWTSEEVDKVLNDSPWARGKTVQPEQTQQRRSGMGRRGGFGGGFPGGGGGYPGGGGGYPGGGGGYPSSNGGGQNGDGSQQAGPMNLTIRWDSAAPVQQALMRRGSGESDELKAAKDASEKFYVISVQGLRLPRPRSSYNNSDDSDNDDNSQRNTKSQNDSLRTQLMDAAQLAPKGRSSIYAQDVQIDGPGGIDGVRFLFPRTNPIGAGDKEVDFILNLRRIKVEEKFKLNDMQYEGKLAL
ncbi:MAG TPA: hypothetical protein VK724_25170 [Bryobacteraceae bacterium]|jgi:Glycine rich protein family|nr:hypothetical protein [Bryobacteraceae bacterium]